MMLDEMSSDESKSANYDHLLNWMMSRIGLLEIVSNDKEALTNVLVEFITGLGPKTLCILKQTPSARNAPSVADDEDMPALRAPAPAPVYTFVCQEIDKFALSHGLCGYFLRSNHTPLTRDNIQKEVQYGTIGPHGLTLEAFERIMKGLVEKHVQSNNELTGHYHRCMATLTDAIHCSGHTVLYCPDFSYPSIPEAAADKERLQIMESIVIHWTRQIKDVVNNHDSSGSAESTGPLDEIEFWKVRAQDLLGIQTQLEGKRCLSAC